MISLYHQTKIQKFINLYYQTKTQKITTLYHQIKTPINFWCRRELNLDFLFNYQILYELS